MIAIIAEKPSVGLDIARVVGADTRNDGYCSGNGYMVTWALGHLVSLAMPDTYGYTKTAAENLPMLPDPFRLVSRQMRTDRGMVTDIAASKQLKVIESVFNRCDSIIVATDAGREGELIFRWIYDFLGCTKPFRRLWISSLTDEAIRKGLEELKDGSEYDSLYAAADSRAKADWLVGMNASRALAAVSGSANNSIGRVQTPTLAMICARFKENRNFVSTPYWQLHITLKQGEAHRLFIHPEHFGDKKAAETAYGRIIPGSAVTITKVERGTVFQQAPLLYDLTSLQKDCNIHHDLTADKTLSIAQSLYEKKLVSYPRTGSRYIPEDIMANIPALLEKIIAMPLFREYGRSFDFSALNTRSVDTTKVTDHHALIITVVRGGIRRLHPDSRQDAGSLLPALREGAAAHGVYVRGHGFPLPLRLHRQHGLAGGIRPEGGPGKGRAGRWRRNGLVCRRRAGSALGSRTVAEEDPAQAALHGSHAACRHGELRKGYHGRRGT